MRIIADTSLLVRAVMGDHPRHSRMAQDVLREAKVVAIPVPVLCEFVSVLTRGYDLPADEVADVVRALTSSSTVATNRPAVEAGIAVLQQGGDFTDGVITFEGQWLGGETFLSFDRQAVRTVLRSDIPGAEG